MTNPQTTNAPLRLAQYLKEFVGLRTTTVRDVTKYDAVVWFGDMPQEKDCFCPAWVDGCEPGEPWLEVKKQHFETMPKPPDTIQQWIDERALKRATEQMPALKVSILMPDELAQLDEGESAPLIEVSLSNYPEVVSAYDRYRPSWQAWSDEYRRRQEIQNLYAKLFSLHTQLRKQGELLELVIGLGLLDWRAPIGGKVIPIRRHMIAARVELAFEPGKGVMRLVPPGDGARLQIEDDMLEVELRPDRSQYQAVKLQLDHIGDEIWDKSLMPTALKHWAGALNADSLWSADLRSHAGDQKKPVVSFAPALILRKRTQTGMVRIYEALIDQLSDESAKVPEGWCGLIDDVDDLTGDGSSENGERRLVTPTGIDNDQIYFPLPANKEQRRIVQAIDRQRGVLVQGPPGTGKSHTIANLICHLLATGKRVLITAETGRALQVLKLWWTPFSGQNSVEISYGVRGVVDWLKSGSGRGQWEKTRLIHKRPEGEVAGKHPGNPSTGRNLWLRNCVDEITHTAQEKNPPGDRCRGRALLAKRAHTEDICEGGRDLRRHTGQVPASGG